MPAPEPVDASALDASQRAVVAHDGGHALVVGAPGSGKTTTLVELLAARVAAGLEPHQVLVIAAGRLQATTLRERIASRVQTVSTGPWARTAMAIAFEAVTERARIEGAPPPRLLSGADHDSVIRELLEGHIASGSGPAWPEHLDASVRVVAGFRTELRELMMRLTERGAAPARLAELGRARDRPEWVAAAGFIDEYQRVVAQSHPQYLDPAELTAFAEQAVRDGLAGERLASVRLVLVDDLHQASEGTIRLLRAFADAGAAVIAFGDPDLAVDTFRGAGAGTVAAFRARMGAPDAPLHVLSAVHRHGPALRALVRRVTDGIGTAGSWQQRRAESARDADDTGSAVTLLQPSAWTLAGAIARELRERHVFDRVPWGRLAVVVRSRGEVAGLERHLAAGQVPVRVQAAGRPLRDHVEAAALLRIVEVAIGRVELDGAVAAELLGGPYAGLDALALRRLRLALRAEALEGDDTRPSGELLAEALAAPAGFATIDHAIGRRAASFAALLAAVRAAHVEGSSAEELLWEAWNRSGVAEPWRALALGTGVTAEEANRALDGVVALFSSARRFSESRPLATVHDFLAELLDAEIPEDTLAPRAVDDAVLITTPSGVVGAEFDTVVVAGLQDGRWPDLRVRGTLLGAPQLVDALAGVDVPGLDRRRLVLDDELRMLAVAVSRASRRVVLAAIDSDDEQPSPVIRMLAEHAPEPKKVEIAPLTLRALTGRLRRTLTWIGDDGLSHAQRDRGEVAAALARLAAEGMPGAAPDGWRGIADASTHEPLVDLTDPEARVRVSPSKLGTLARSPMEWFVESHAGGGSGLLAGFGTLIHDVFEHADTPATQTFDAMWSALQERWGELEFASEWVSEQQKRAARRALEALAFYLAEQRESGIARVSAEQSFEVDEAPATLSGKIDRVESHDGGIVIVDLKTGSVRPASETLGNPQLSAYQLAYARGAIDDLPEGHRAGGARLLFSKSGTAKKPYTTRDQPPLDDAELADFAAEVRDAARTMAGAEFTAVLIDDPFLRAGAEVRAVQLPGEVSSD